MTSIEIYDHAIERARHFRALAARQESEHSRYYIGKVAESWDDVADRTLDEMIDGHQERIEDWSSSYYAGKGR